MSNSIATMNTTITPAVSPTKAPTLTGRLEGRGLYFGATADNGTRRVFTQAMWDATCRQIARPDDPKESWGIRYLHPKVSDGTQYWYSPTDMKMLRDVAASYGLVCAPYMYCYGDHFGALEAEAKLLAQIGAVFGIVLPDIEVQWNGHADWALRYGQVLDNEITRLGAGVEVYPDLFPNPSVQSTPYLEILSWRHVRGWRPMVYFSVWQDLHGHQDNAQEAYNYVYPMWQALNAKLIAHHVTPPAIYPIIEVAGLPQVEVKNWATMMQHYGYIGYWYDKPYPAYADTVRQAPVPSWTRPTPTPTPPPPVISKPAPPTPAPASAPVSVSEKRGTLEFDGQGILRQGLSTDQLNVLWHLVNQQVPYNLGFALRNTWETLITHFPGLIWGSPTGDEQHAVIDGHPVQTLHLSSGKTLVYFQSDGTLAVI